MVNSDHLRTATNYFCPEFARLFLFDYDRETFRETYDCILACQQAKELKSIPNQPPVSESTSASATVPPVAPDKSIGIKATEPPVEIKTKEEPTSPGVYLAMGILSGAAIALLSVGVLAPMFALTSPFSILVLTGGVALISAGVACVVVDQEEITQTFTFSAEAEPAFPAPSEEERQLREHSLKTLNQQQNPNLSSPPKPKTVTSKADATAALSEEEKQLRERSLKQLDQHQHADLPAPSKTFTPNVDATAAAAQGAKQTVVNEPLKQPTEPVKKPAA